MQKYLDFTIRIYSQQTQYILDRLISSKSTIHFYDLLTHVINFISSLITLGLINNIKMAKLDSIITTGCSIVADYISISKEEELSNLAYQSKYTDAIQFALQKVTTRFGLDDRHLSGDINNVVPFTLNSKPTSLFLLPAGRQAKREQKKREFSGTPVPGHWDRIPMSTVVPGHWDYISVSTVSAINIPDHPY
jgi:hypothetical protein